MWVTIKKKNMISLWLGVALLLSAVSAQGEQRYDIHNDPIAHGALEFSGSIDALPLSGQRPEITIDDKVYNLLNDCIFRNQFGTLVSLASFRAGMSVRFFVHNKTDITKLWQVENEGDESDDGRQIDIERPPAANGQLRKENGVWTN